MANNKEITLSARLDDAQLIQDFANIQKKVRQLMEQEQRMSNNMAINQNMVNAGMPAMGKSGQQAFQQTYNQNNNTMRAMYMAEVVELQKLDREKDKLTKKLEIQSKIYENMKSQGKDLLEIEKRKAETAERLVKANQDLQRQQQLLLGSNKLLRPDLAPGAPMGPPAPPETTGGGGGLGNLGKIVSAIGIAGVVNAIQAVGSDYARRPIDVARMQGSAAAGTTGRVLGQMQSGEFAYEGMFAEERAKATREAKGAETRGRAFDIAQVVGGVGLLIGGLAATVTGVGAVPGLAAAGIGAGMLFNKRSMLDKEKYEAEKAAQYADDYNAALAANKEMTPFKKDAIEKLQKSGGSYLAAQRSMGMSDKQLFGFFQNMGYSGFTDQMGLQASSAILGAGGSSAMARSSEVALKAERGLGLTNATQLLGQISGTQGIPETSKRTLIDIFAQGQMIGLDNSKYAEENRRFMQNVAESVSKGGTTSEDAAQTIARIMGSFTGGGTTMRGLEAAKSAYEAYSNVGSSTSGYTGALNISGLLTSAPGLRNIKDPAALQELLSLRPNEIDVKSPDIIDAARQANMTPQALVDLLQQQKGGVAAKALNRSGELGVLTNKMKEYRASHGGSIAGFHEQNNIEGMASLMGMAGVINPQLDRAGRQAYVEGIADMPNMTQPEKEAFYKKQAAYKMEDKDTGLAGDKVVQASAMNAQTSLKTLSESIDKFATDALAAAARMGNVTVPNAKAADAALHAAEAAEAQTAAELYKLRKSGNLSGEYEAMVRHAAAATSLSKAQDTAAAANKATSR